MEKIAEALEACTCAENPERCVLSVAEIATLQLLEVAEQDLAAALRVGAA